MRELGQRGIEFYSLMENIDTTSARGRLVFHLMAALAEFERSLISERTKAGIEAAKFKGIHVGRPRRPHMKSLKNDPQDGEPLSTIKTVEPGQAAAGSRIKR